MLQKTNEICLGCGQKCCKNENLFVEFQFEPFCPTTLTLENGDCSRLSCDGCTIYDRRPLECRMFPLDVKIIDNNMALIMWDCPLSRDLDIEEEIERFEQVFLIGEKAGIVYLLKYIEYHQKNEPSKYLDQHYKILKTYKLFD